MLPFVTPAAGLEIEAIPHYHFRDEMVSRSRNTNSEAKVYLPLRRDIQIDRGEDLLLLLRDSIEARDRPNRTLVFQSPRDFAGEVIAEFEIRRKDDALVHAFAVKRAVKRRVQGPIPSPDL